MPSELRYIAFSRTEVRDALAIGAVRRFAQLGDREIIDVGLQDAEGRRALSVLLPGKRAGTIEEHSLSVEMVAAALVVYCQRQHIPLPRHGAKSIEVEAERVILRIGRRAAVPAGFDPITAENTEAATLDDAAA